MSGDLSDEWVDLPFRRPEVAMAHVRTCRALTVVMANAVETNNGFLYLLAARELGNQLDATAMQAGVVPNVYDGMFHVNDLMQVSAFVLGQVVEAKLPSTLAGYAPIQAVVDAYEDSLRGIGGPL